MSTAVGPGVVKNGLIYSLDAANIKCGSSNIFPEVGNAGPGAASDNAVSFDVNGNGTFYRLGYGQTFGGYTIKPEDVVYKFNLGSNGYFYHGYRATANAGIQYTFTFDYYISPDAVNLGIAGNQTMLANIENYGSGTSGGTIYLANTNLGIWQTVSVTSGTTTTLGQTALFLYPGANGRIADSGYILYRNPRVYINNTSISIPFSSSRIATKSDLIAGRSGNPTNGLWHSSLNSGYFSFDGVNDVMLLPNSSEILPMPNMSWEIVFKTSGLGSGMTTGGLLFLNYGMVSYIDTNGSIRFVIYDGSSEALNINYAGSYFDNKWHHAVFVIDGDTGYIYVDGILVKSQAVIITSRTGTNTWAAMQMRIGDDANNIYHKFNGNISMVKIYNRGLSSTEVSQNFNALRGRYGI